MRPQDRTGTFRTISFRPRNKHPLLDLGPICLANDAPSLSAAKGSAGCLHSGETVRSRVRVFAPLQSNRRLYRVECRASGSLKLQTNVSIIRNLAIMQIQSSRRRRRASNSPDVIWNLQIFVQLIGVESDSRDDRQRNSWRWSVVIGLTLRSRRILNRTW